MKRLDTKDTPVAGNTYTLQAKNMPSGMFIDKFYLKLTMSFVLGGAPLAHQQEAVAECISRIFSNEGNLRCDISAKSLLILESQRERSRCALNPGLGPADTTYILYVPVNPAPFGGYPGAAADRFKTSELAKQGFDITLANPFDPVNDRTPTFDKIELFGDFTDKGPAQTKFEELGLIANYKEVTGIESDVLAVTSVQPAMMLINTRDTVVPQPFTRLDITAERATGGSITLAQNATSLDLDAKDQQFDRDLWNDDRVVGGNQLLQDILRADGITVDQYTKLYDARNPGDQSAVIPLSIEFQSKATSDIKYIIAGYISGGAQRA